MSPPEDAPLAPPRWRWLDSWFAVRWRALLTWVVLAVLSGAVTSSVGLARLYQFSNQALFEINRLSPVQVPAEFKNIVYEANLLLFWVWFEPFALQLNLLRGVLWLALRITPYAVLSTFITPADANVVQLVLNLLASAVLLPVLRGWRSRPWMVLIGGAFFFASGQFIQRMLGNSGALFWVAMLSISYAAVLLYGTRLLCPKERFSAWHRSH